jgi:hypothetical protein
LLPVEAAGVYHNLSFCMVFGHEAHFVWTSITVSNVHKINTAY